MNKTKLIKIISGVLFTGVAAYGSVKNREIICEKLNIKIPTIKNKKKKELEERVLLKIQKEKDNSKKICELFGSNNTEIEELVEEIIKKYAYLGFKNTEPKQYESTIYLLNAILYYFVEFGNPDKYNLITFDEMANKTKHVSSPVWDIFNPELDKIKEEHPNSKCAYYYKEFKSHYMALTAFKNARHIFGDFNEYNFEVGPNFQRITRKIK